MKTAIPIIEFIIFVVIFAYIQVINDKLTHMDTFALYVIAVVSMTLRTVLKILK